MEISSLTGLLPGLRSQQNITKANDRLNAALASLVTGDRITSAGQDVASLALATQLQSESSALKSASGNLAQASSMLQVADGGIGQIGMILDRLQTISTQSNSGALNDDARKALNQEFQQLTQEITRISKNTSFSGRPLLDGSLSGSNALSVEGLLALEGESDSLSALSIGSLDAASLLGSNSLNLLSQTGSAAALGAISDAIKELGRARANVGAFQESVGYASANLESAIFNQEAARSVLSDADIASLSTARTNADLQRNAGIALAAQGNRLTPALLALVS